MWANRSICSYSDFNLTRIMQSLYYAPAGRYIIAIVPIEGAVLFELILTLLMWQNFNTKQGMQKKTVGMETLNTHCLLNFVQKN